MQMFLAFVFPSFRFILWYREYRDLERVIKSLSLLVLIAIYDQFSLSLLTYLLSQDKIVAELPRNRTSCSIRARNRAQFYELSMKF